ncbi:Mu transposase C-terminal domain-containing protein [Muricoccus vinaceus]|uniref:Mu transposase C-terminal domain-containing protein n=1 Tax=Muricoccus vinaceus TaxID=424704 RepID=A0ABV6IU08_9PROT
MTPSLKLRSGDHLVREGVRHKVLSRSKDGQINLLRVSDETLSSVPERTLLQEYGVGLLQIDRRQEVLSERALQILETDTGDLVEAARAKAEFRLPFVREMLRDRRRRWSNKALQELIDKVRQQENLPKAPSSRSLRRWAERAIALGFEELGDVRILVPRNHACGGTQPKFAAQVLTIMDSVIQDLVMLPEPVSGAEAYLEFKGRLNRKQQELSATLLSAAPTLLEPSKRTFYRKLKAISQETLAIAREGRLEADKKHSLVGLGPQGDHLLHEVEVDHTLADIIVVCPHTGVPIGRPTITIAVDRWSRMIVGIHIGLEAAGWRAVMLCLRNGILPKEHLLEVDPGDLRAKGHWPAMGLMKTLVLDNGPEFHCAALRNAALEFGITLQFCPAGQPRYKGKTERLFRRMNVEVFHTLAGTTFSNPAQRGSYDSKANAFLTVDQLRAIVHRWVTDVYCNTPHSFTKQAPNERWEEGLRLIGGVTLPSSAADVMLALAQVEYRRLTRKGIELYGLHYCEPRSVHLRELLNHPDAPKAVKVRIDPDNLGTVHVEDYREPGLYVPVACTDRGYAEGMTIAEHHMVAARARAQLKARQVATMGMLIEAKASLRADIGRVRNAGKLTATRLNTIFPDATGKVTDVGEDGKAIPQTGLPVSVAARRPTARPVPQVVQAPRRGEFGVSF